MRSPVLRQLLTPGAFLEGCPCRAPTSGSHLGREIGQGRKQEVCGQAQIELGSQQRNHLFILQLPGLDSPLAGLGEGAAFD